MLEACLIPARESFLPSADARWPAPSIAVGYLEPDALRAPRVRDTLDVLVPTGSGNLFATSLVDVAAEVGFRTQGHFTGVFHRYTGCTPRVFRLNARAAAATSPPGERAGAIASRPAARRP